MKFLDINFIKNLNTFFENQSTENNTITIYWVLIGCTISRDTIEYRHEYPPIIEELFEKSNYVYNQESNITINQHILKIDPRYENEKPKYPRNINDDYYMLKNDNTNNKLLIYKIDRYLSNVDYNSILLTYISKFKKFNTLLGIMDFTSRDWTPISKEYSNKIWIGPSDCLANVDSFLYKPIIEVNDNKYEWKYLQNYEYNQLYLNDKYSYEHICSLICYGKWFHIEKYMYLYIEILKILNISNDAIQRNNDVVIKPDYFKNSKLLDKSIDHLMYRLKYIKYYDDLDIIIQDWKETNIVSLLDYIITQLDFTINKYQKIIFIPNTKINDKNVSIIKKYKEIYNYFLSIH